MIFRSDNRGLSLVEQKKLQWAKEKGLFKIHKIIWQKFVLKNVIVFFF